MEDRTVVGILAIFHFGRSEKMGFRVSTCHVSYVYWLICQNDYINYYICMHARRIMQLHIMHARRIMQLHIYGVVVLCMKRRVCIYM